MKDFKRWTKPDNNTIMQQSIFKEKTLLESTPLKINRTRRKRFNLKILLIEFKADYLNYIEMVLVNKIDTVLSIFKNKKQA